MKDNEMTDDQIIQDREEKYGPPLDCFRTWATICTALMAALKMVRSVWSPYIDDNYADGRNYFSIAQTCSRDAFAKDRAGNE